MSADHETIRLRGEIRRADSATLEAARRERGIDFQDADAELRSMVLTVNERFTHADLERWVWHPDELVPITLACLGDGDYCLAAP